MEKMFSQSSDFRPFLSRRTCHQHFLCACFRFEEGSRSSTRMFLLSIFTKNRHDLSPNAKGFVALSKSFLLNYFESQSPLLRS